MDELFFEGINIEKILIDGSNLFDISLNTTDGLILFSETKGSTFKV